jgi:glycerol-3-phosphate O-acyltransferase
MFCFITSLRAPQASANWPRVCELFERTAVSVFAQTESNFRLIVAGHAPPILRRQFDARLEFIADLLRDYLESYLLAAMTVQDLATEGPMDKKAFVKAALETGRSEFLAGRIGAAEALSKPTFENAVSFLLDQKALVEDGKLLKLGPAADEPHEREELLGSIRQYLRRRVD